MTGLHDEPQFEHRLWRYAHGEPDPGLERHLSTCDECREQVAALRPLAHFQETTGGRLAEPPASLMTRLSSLLPAIRPDLVPKPASFGDTVVDRLRQVLGRLVLDTGVTPQLAGLRGGRGPVGARQLAFVSEVADLDLEVVQSANTVAVSGQLGMDSVPADLSIRFVPADQDPLVESATGVVETGISEQGYFALTLTSGEWVAAVDIDDAVVLFPGVQL
jgi:hypothetical protein